MNDSIFITFTQGALATLSLQWAAWLLAFALQTETFYDVAGGLNYLLLAYLGSSSGNMTPRQSAWTRVFCISRGWLLLFLGWRAFHRGGDARFDHVKDKFWHFGLFWTAQAMWCYLIAWPLLVVQTLEGRLLDGGGYSNTSLAWPDYASLAGFALGVVMEMQSDVQKAKWVASGRKGGFCTVGWWKYSRHPNYCGEMLQWWCAWIGSYQALSAFDSSSPFLWLWLAGLVSPLFTMHILLNVTATGVWNAEGKNLKRYYESPQHGEAYRQYREQTSIVIPMVGYAAIPLWIKRTFLLEWERYEYRPNKKE